MMMSLNVDESTGEVLKVLADPLRRRLVELLAVEQLCTCHLVAETGTGQTTVSNALRVLRAAEMVETEACGRFTYYRLRPEALAAVASDLTALADGARDAQHRKRPC